MRRDVQEIFRNTPHGKQVMMFSATLSKDIRPVCKKFMQDVCHYYHKSKLQLQKNKTSQKRKRSVESKERGWEKFKVLIESVA